MTGLPLWAQLINLLAAVLLLLAFAMLAQRRVLTLDRPLRRAGLRPRLLDGHRRLVRRASRICSGPPGLTLVLKVGVLPWLLHRLDPPARRALGRRGA